MTDQRHAAIRSRMFSTSPGASGRPSRSWASCWSASCSASLIIPVVQGRSAGHRRLHGDLPRAGHPAGLARAAAVRRTARRRLRFRRWSGRRTSCRFSLAPMCAKGQAKVQEVCVACHGEKGVSVAPEFPHLAGQSGAAIYKQLHDYRTGSRVNPLMTDIAKALDESRDRRCGGLLCRPAEA